MSRGQPRVAQGGTGCGSPGRPGPKVRFVHAVGTHLPNMGPPITSERWFLRSLIVHLVKLTSEMKELSPVALVLAFPGRGCGCKMLQAHQLFCWTSPGSGVHACACQALAAMAT